MEWQPIETAPKDGTHVLLFYPHYKLPVCIGNYIQTERREHGVVIYQKEYWSSRSWLEIGDIPEPTHWMPLPSDPPNGGGTDG